jgi:hypothetical protein
MSHYLLESQTGFTLQPTAPTSPEDADLGTILAEQIHVP